MRAQRLDSGRIPAARPAAMALLGLAVALGGCSVNTSLSGNFTGYHSDVESVQVISALIGGKNVFIPSTIVVTDGGPRTLRLFNTTDAPHGFAIDGLDIELVLPVREELEVHLPPLVGGHVYRIHCQLHPPHRSATLVVLEGDGAL
jgi:hypothetical protein